MKIRRAAAIPLILHDPFFSIWSCADHLYDKDTQHWCKKNQTLRGYIKVDDDVFCFLGHRGCHIEIPQTFVDVTATSTKYVFENSRVELTVQFTSPLLLSEPILVSRPCTYLDITVEKKKECKVEVFFEIHKDVVCNQNELILGEHYYRPKKNGSSDYNYAFMGRAYQTPLAGSADLTTIDWGYVYLACRQKQSQVIFDGADDKLRFTMSVVNRKEKAELLIAYDDLVSINYFGEWRKGYWTKAYPTILDAIAAAFADKEDVLKKAEKFDAELHKNAMAIGGEKFAYLCNLSYRQTVAAHKLISDEEGNLIFLSKENDSNGCIGTLDVTYPSVPLFFLYDVEYVKGMLRPIFRFAESEVWEENFAPHDVGRYPYAWGNVYGCRRPEGVVLPPFYMYPSGSRTRYPGKHMPVEECGNILILMAAICRLDGNGKFAEPHQAELQKWVEYLTTYGLDPGEQLCTDDFGGHLAHNTNLSIKAIMGIEGYSIIMENLGDQKAREKYHKLAKEMAAEWEKNACAGDHYSLVFGDSDTWSMKYNLVWDKLFGSQLFSEDVYQKELAWYVQKLNKYGTPLDSRKDYSKSDWILWCVAMADDKEQAQQLMEPVADYLEQSPSRVPFSDWYDTVTGEYEQFIARSVQGGIYMPLFMEGMKK